MRDLNRKLDKYIQEKAASAKKAKKNTPHVTYKVSNAPSNPTSAKSRHSRAFSMTVAFFNPRFDDPYPKHFAIHHETTEQRKVESDTTGRYKSPKRDPIVQNNDEPVHEVRPTIKCFPTSNIFEREEEPLFAKKSRGEYNHVENPRSASPKIQSIKTFVTLPSDSKDENPRRKLKAVQRPNEQVYNPITQGDPKGVTLIKERVPPQISEQTKKINDRMSILPCERPLLSERAVSPRGRVFWDSNIPFATCPTERETDTAPTKVGSPKYNRSEGMSSLIGYTFGPSFRDQGVSDKCTNVPYSSRLKSPSNE